MKTLLAIASLGLASCSGFTITATTPFGDVRSIDGATFITPKAVVIPSGK